MERYNNSTLIEQFSNNCAGLGLLVKNLYEYDGEDRIIFIGRCYLPEQKLGDIMIVGTGFRLNQDDADTVWDAMFVKNMTIKFEMAIENINSNIVNFHDIGGVMQQCICVCIKKGIRLSYRTSVYWMSKCS